MDIDLLGITDNSVDKIAAIARGLFAGGRARRSDFRTEQRWGERTWRMPTTEVFVSDSAERLGRHASLCSWILVSVMSLCPSRKWPTIQRS